jgi:hypothetical protein
MTKKDETLEQSQERLRKAVDAVAEYRARESGISEQIARLKALRLAQSDLLKKVAARGARGALQLELLS